MVEVTDKMKMVTGETRVKLIIGDVIGMYNYIHLFKKQNVEREGGGEVESFIANVLFKEQAEK